MGVDPKPFILVDNRFPEKGEEKHTHTSGYIRSGVETM